MKKNLLPALQLAPAVTMGRREIPVSETRKCRDYLSGCGRAGADSRVPLLFKGLWLLVSFAVLLALQGPALAEDLSLSRDKLDEYLRQINPEPTVKFLSGLPSRVPGYEGSDRAADFVYSKFEAFGLNPEVETFKIAVPKDKGAALKLPGLVTPLALKCLWPNFVRTSKLPSTGITGSLLYAGSGALKEFNNKPVKGSIVLMDFNCATRWLNAAMLGAKAVIFIEPDTPAFRAESTQKFLSVPVAIPRYWINRDQLRKLAKTVLETRSFQSDEEMLKALLALGLEKKGGRKDVKADLACNMNWVMAEAKNLVATVPGSDPSLSKQIIVLSAYYDSNSVIPALAPGADAACSIAALLEMARLFAKNPPKRTVKFLATSAHFQAMAGIRDWTARHIYLQKEKGKVAIEYFNGKEVKEEEKRRGLFARFIGWVKSLFGSGEEVEKVPGKLDKMKEDAEILTDLPGPGLWDSFTTWSWGSLTDRWHSQPVELFLHDFDRLFEDLDVKEQFLDASEEIYEFRKELKQAKTAKDLAMLKTVSKKIADAYLALHDQFVEIASEEKPEPIPTLFIGLDLSSRGQQMGVFYKGHFYDEYGSANEFRLQRQMAASGDRVLAYADAVKEIYQDWQAELVSGVVPKRGRDWRSYMPDRIALEGELPLLAGTGSLSFVTTNDTRGLLDTPSDTFDRFDGQNLLGQTRLLFPLLYEILNNPTFPHKYKLDNLYGDIYARVIEDQLISYLPQTPVAGSLVSVGLNETKSMMGVRGHTFQITRENGIFEVFGASLERSKYVTCWSFKMDPKDGSIEKITNLASKRPAGSPYRVRGRRRSWYQRALGARGLSRTSRSQRPTDQRLPIFPCASLTAFELMDQLYLSSFTSLSVLDARSNTSPKYFATFLGRKVNSSYSEPVAVAYAEPDTDIKLIFSSGLLGAKFTLINAGDPKGKHYEGRGFNLREREGAILFTPYRAVRDMWNLDEGRMSKLLKTGIRNKQLEDLHSDAKKKLAAAEHEHEANRYDEFMNLAREAWALEARAYPSVQSTANDVIKGVIFYFAILLPFAFFGERLFFAFADIRKQLVAVACIFLGVYFILHFVHPAFRISKTPVIILDGFFTLVMGGIVIVIVMNKFNQQMAKIREKTSSVHGADVARGSATMAAFILGISNMRRRKMRTALTCVTLVLLTFTVMSFTSFDQGLAFNKIETTYKAKYKGVLLRRRDWGPLEEQAYYSITDFFKAYEDSKLAIRTWKAAQQVGETLSLQIMNADDPKKTFSAQAMVGLSSSEGEITRPNLIKGRWFQPEEDQGEFVCIVPKRMAEFLGISQDDFAPGKYRVSVSGDTYSVVGIVDGGEFYENKDLDNESLTPVDFIEMASRGGEEEQQSSEEEDTQGEEALPELYIHMEGDNVLLIPAGLSLQLGASLRSIAVKMEHHDSAAMDMLLKDYVRRLKMILFAGMKDRADEPGEVLLYSSRGSLSVSGLKGLLVPIVIAALIVFNTMLGSVYERTREISIYAAVGLAPVHISSLFLAESSVYATVGAIVGYLVGQVVAKIIVTFHVWEDLSLNYSSTAAVVTTLVVVATVLLSTAFPAKKAAELSVPDETRKFALPKPDGDNWVFDFPFTVSKSEAVAINMFLYEYFNAHDEDSIGRFCADQTKFSVTQENGEPVYLLESQVWIAPLDMGISQNVRIETRESSDDERVNVLRFHIHRESGEVDTWRRMNTGYFKDLRKQLLIWRLVDSAYKRELVIKGFEILGEEPPAAVLENLERLALAETEKKRREAEAMGISLDEEENEEDLEDAAELPDEMIDNVAGDLT